MKSHWVVVYEKDKNQEDMEQRKGECFTIITFIDSYNFEGSDTYSGEGISLHMVVKREDLENFVTDLEAEYKNFELMDAAHGSNK